MPSTIRKLSVIDSAFLFAETTECPMHVGSTSILKLPDDYAGDFYADVRNVMISRMATAKSLTWKLSPTPFDIDRPSWIEDEQFDLDRHLFRAALPEPCTRATLMRLTGFLHARQISRTRPLWEMYVFSGLPDREVAVYMKMHHSLIDGGAGAALAEVLYDAVPTPAPVDPPAFTPPKPRSEQGARDVGVSMMAAYAAWLRQPFGDVRAADFSLPRSGGNDLGSVLFDAAVHQIEWPIRLAQHSSDYAKAYGDAMQAALKPESFKSLQEQYMAPPTPLNVAISSERTFAGATIALDRAKALAKRSGATINDLVLALASGMLRRYLKSIDALPKQSLTAFVPISARVAGDADSKNAVFGMVAPLATNVEDPKARLETIIKETSVAKELANPFKGVVSTLSDVPTFGSPMLLQLAATFWSRTRLANVVPPGVNVVVSNVMYSKKPLYLAGARLLHAYPMSIPVHGQALNITVHGYCNNLDFGLTAAANVLPDLEPMMASLFEEFDALEAAVAAGT